MKFAYTDESGSRDESDCFAMAALLFDAYRIRRITKDFDALMNGLLQRHPGRAQELKTKNFLRGGGGWSRIPGQERQAYVRSICELAAKDGTIYAIGLSFAAFDAASNAGHNQPENFDYWLASGSFLASLIQRHMQKESHGKGLTVLIVDDNKARMPALSELIHTENNWFDGLYEQKFKNKKGDTWRIPGQRFDQLIDTGFAIKSQHSSLIQVADTVSYVYRRNLEILSGAEEGYDGEAAFYQGLVNTLDARRKRLGNCRVCAPLSYFRAVRHPNWQI